MYVSLSSIFSRAFDPVVRSLPTLDDNYPDPTAYQWTFTGSNENKCVEFFEKDYGRTGIIKLDFYYAIGTARTILDHPTKGEKRLYGKKKTLRPNVYRNILLNPKVHTDGYYRKKARQVT